MIIIGSKALAYHGCERRTPVDTDRFLKKGEKVELMEDDHVIPDEIHDLIHEVDGYATPDAIYTIKCSHFEYDIHWQKTKLDILWLKKKHGCCIIEPLYKALKDYWKTVHGAKEFLSLNMKKDEFFNDFVEYNYDHDYLHELVSYPNAPMYTKCLKDGEDVLTDWDKFSKMQFQDKVRMLREEITVIACERWLLVKNPNPNINWYKAYMMSLHKTLTRLVKNGYADFIVRNIECFVTPDFSYFENLLKTLKEKEMNELTTTQSVLDEFISHFKGSKDNIIVALADEVEELEIEMDTDRPNYKEHEACTAWWNEHNAKIQSLFDEYGYEHVMQEGGGEGGAEYCEGVFKLRDKYYHVSWSYYSHEGYDTYGAYDSVTEVKPVQKTITVYK